MKVKVIITGRKPIEVEDIKNIHDLTDKLSQKGIKPSNYKLFNIKTKTNLSDKDFSGDELKVKAMPNKIKLGMDTPVELFITPEFYNQYMYLNSKVPNTEWMGEVYYGQEIKDNKIVIEPKYIILKNIGTSSSINYEADDHEIEEEAIKAYDLFPEIEDMNIGTIHSHHNMLSVSFSNTDMKDLERNTPEDSDTGYLSLVVYNNGDITGYLGLYANVERKFFGFKYKTKEFTAIPLKVIFPERKNVDKNWKEFTDSLIKIAEKNKSSYQYRSYFNSRYGSRSLLDNDYDY